VRTADGPGRQRGLPLIGEQKQVIIRPGRQTPLERLSRQGLYPETGELPSVTRPIQR
jgi:hypothetical protein